MPNRRGDTLIELVIAVAILLLFFAGIFKLVGFNQVVGKESAERLSAISSMEEVKEVARNEWESAERMQAGYINPKNLTSIAFKKDFSPYGEGTHWVQYSISGKELRRNGTNLLSNVSNKMRKLDNTHYFRLYVYAMNGTPLASNLGNIPRIQGINDAATGFWNLSLIYDYDNYPQVIAGSRVVTPDFKHPVPVDSHNFNMPMDTTKYGSWTDSFHTTTDLSALGDEDIRRYSSFLGVPAKWGSKITVHPIMGGIAGTLYEPIRGKGISSAVVELYTGNGKKFVSITDSGGNFFFIANLSPVSGSNIIIFEGNDTYEGCEKTYP